MGTAIDARFASGLASTKPYASDPDNFREKVLFLVFVQMLATEGPHFGDLAELDVSTFTETDLEVVREVKRRANADFDDAIRNHQTAVKNLTTELLNEKLSNSDREQIWKRVNDAKARTREARRIEEYARILPWLYEQRAGAKLVDGVIYLLRASLAYSEDNENFRSLVNSFYQTYYKS